MLGLFHRTVTLDFDSALVYLDQARALAPGSARIALYRASVLWSAGRLDAALVEARRGAGLDPLNYSATSRVSRILLWQHRYDEAWALHMELREPLVEAGRGSPFVMADGPLILAAQGLADSAQSLVARIPEASFSASIGAYMMDFNFQSWLVDPAVRERVCADRGEVVRTGFTYFDHDRLTGCALAAWLNDDLDHARVLADSARTLVTSVVEDRPRSLRPRLVLAYAHLLAGDTAQAIVQADSSLALMAPSWDFYPGAFAHIRYAQLTAMAGDVDRSVRELEGLLGGYSPLTRDWVRVDPAFDSIRDDARFKALLTAR